MFLRGKWTGFAESAVAPGGRGGWARGEGWTRRCLFFKTRVKAAKGTPIYYEGTPTNDTQNLKSAKVTRPSTSVVESINA